MKAGDSKLTLGTNVFRGTRIFLLYISAQISYPPSMQRFLERRVQYVYWDGRSKSYLSDPIASTTTSSSLSVSREINAPTMFFPCNKRRVEGSFCIRFDTATQAHFRSAASALSIWPRGPSASILHEIDSSIDLLYYGENSLRFRRRRRRRCKPFWKMRVWYSHGIMSTHSTLFLWFAHRWCWLSVGRKNFDGWPCALLFPTGTPLHRSFEFVFLLEIARMLAKMVQICEQRWLQFWMMLYDEINCRAQRFAWHSFPATTTPVYQGRYEF